MERAEFMRAEEIILDVYKEKLECSRKGNQPRQVVMNMEQYRTVQNYHRQLGTLEGNMPDYISTDSLFGLDILIDNREEISVS